MVQIAPAFFSYSRLDSEFAIRLAEDLKAAGANVWIDQLDILPGQRWDRAVEEALRRCPCLLVILSTASISSNNVMDEVSYALQQNKHVIPILYQDCSIPFRLHRLQYLDFRRDYARRIKELLNVLVPAENEQPTGIASENEHAKSEDGRGEAENWEQASNGEPRTLSSPTDAVVLVAFSFDGRLLAAWVRDDTIRVWEVASSREVRTINFEHLVCQIALSPDGRWLAAALGESNVAAEAGTAIWEVASGRNVRTFSHPAFSVAFSPDGRWLASGCDGGAIKLWEVPDWREVRTLRHTSSVDSVGFGPDGRWLAAVGAIRQRKCGSCQVAVRFEPWVRYTTTPRAGARSAPMGVGWL